jgi:hypothetical protein
MSGVREATVSARAERPLASALVDALDDAALDALADLLAPLLEARLAHRREDEWFDARGAADYLGLSLPALHRQTTREARSKPGGVPAHQDVPGGKLWFLKSELDDWRRAQ